MIRSVANRAKRLLSRIVILTVMLQNLAIAAPAAQAAPQMSGSEQQHGNSTRAMVAAGYGHTVLLKSDGTVWTWGSNGSGQLGNNDYPNDSNVPVQVSISDVVAVAAGQSNSFALKADGTLWAWGLNANGELGDNTTTDRHAPIQVHGAGNVGFLTDVIAVAAGYYHTLALKSDGTVWAMGDNFFGEVGDSSFTERHVPVQVSSLTNVVTIAAGAYDSMALKSDGTLRAWGYNSDNELGDGTFTHQGAPVTVSGFSNNVRAMATGGNHSIVVKTDGTVWAWGYGGDGELGNAANSDSGTPVQVSGITNATAVYATDYHSGAQLADGTVMEWGANYYGMLGDGTTNNSNVPVTATGLSSVVGTAVGNYHTGALKADGSVWTWGSNSSGELGDGTNSESHAPLQLSITAPVGVSSVVSIVAADSFSVVLKADGTVWATGNNLYGQLGDGQSGVPFHFTPTPVVGLTDVSAVAAQGSNSLALKADGTVWAWGSNANGQLGDGTTTDELTPVQVHGAGDIGFLTDVIAIAAGTNHSLALKADGTVWAWGGNYWGQLGNNDNPNLSDVPVQVHGVGNTGFLTNIVAITAFTDSMAVKADGTVYAWGFHGGGELGDGDGTTDRNYPIEVLDVGGTGHISNVKALSASQHSLALKSDGTLWAWGYGQQGQLGDNDTTYHVGTSPTQVHGVGNVGYFTKVTSIAVTGNSSAARTSDGNVYAWGSDAGYELGDNDTTNKGTPGQVHGTGNVGYLTDVTLVSGHGGSFFLALKPDGTVWGWGSNNYGQVGTGSGSGGQTPVQMIFPDVPDAVTDLAAAAGDTQVSLTWSAPADGGSPITAYAVHYSDDGFSSDDQTCVTSGCTDVTTGATVTGLTNGITYTFRVYAVNAVGTSAASNEPTATPHPPTVPDAITDLAASPGDHEASLTWSAPADGGSAITAYAVHYSNNGFTGDDHTCVTSGCTDTTTGAVVGGLTNGVNYSFRVFATNVVGTSSASNTATATPVAGFYNKTHITFAPYTLDGGATDVTGSGCGGTCLNDDEVSAPIALPFNFDFYGVTKTSINVGSNGFLTFGDTTDGCCSGQHLPDVTTPNGVIAGYWYDLNPNDGGTIKYETFGSGTSHVFVVEFNAIGECCGGGHPTQTFQIMLYETTNVIEIHSTDVSNGGYVVTQGLENDDGTAADVFAGRNATDFSLMNDAVRFDPNPPPPGSNPPTDHNKILLTRLKKDTPSDVSLSFNLTGTISTQLSVSFDPAFTDLDVGSASATTPDAPGCMTNPQLTGANTFTFDKSNCTGSVLITGIHVRTPNAVGTYPVTWVNDAPGGGSVFIVEDDQVVVSATVDPSITFNAGSQATATDCDGGFGGSGGTLALGVLSPAGVTSSDVGGVDHLCTRLTTNALGGAVVSVASANAGLKSTSTADAILSSTGTIGVASENYGLCAGSGGTDSGTDTTSPTGAAPAAASPYDGSCLAADTHVGALTTAPQTVWALSGPSQNAFFRLLLKAEVSPTTPAHADYADTLTFVATGIF